MRFSELFLTVGVLAAVAILANVAEKRAGLRPLLLLALLALNGAFVIVYGRQSEGRSDIQSLALAFGAAAPAAPGAHSRTLAPIFRRDVGPSRGRNAHSGPEVGFDPASPVHMTALVFCLYLFGMVIMDFAIAGGLSGVAEGFQAPRSGSLLATMSLLILFALLGTGLGIRRSLPEALTRLGLRAPTLAELGAGIGITFILFGAVFWIGFFWVRMTPQDVYNQQTQVSGLISASVTTLFLAFQLAVTAAIGEEIAFRGALQPVFGLWPTAIIFSLIHIQYTLTPATLVIVIVAVGFGWLRRRYNTTVAIVAHFLYNFGLLALAIYSRYLFDLIETAMR
jgi:membrane protease YdiL (CAAX protease family)